MTLEKTNIPGYMKDPKTGVVINHNTSEYDQYLANRSRIIELNSMKEKVNTMTNEMNELKMMLSELIKKVK